MFLDHLGLASGGALLDLACGTGNYTAAFARAGLAVTGLDRSSLMIAQAQSKAPRLVLCQGDARQLPFRTDAFDGVACCLAVHHFADIAAPFREAFRVLRRGRLVIFTATPRQMTGYWLNEYFPRMMQGASAVMPDFARLRDALEDAGFSVTAYVPWFVPDDLRDHFMYSGKHRPELYLEERYRAGSSGFRLFGDPYEIANGAERLTRDIADGRIGKVIDGYQNDDGDYGWVLAEKR
jgi:SAM-dependent methyltransferase